MYFFLSFYKVRTVLILFDWFFRQTLNCQQTFFFFVPFVLPYYGPDNTGEILDGNNKKLQQFSSKCNNINSCEREWINGFLNSSLFMADVFIWFDIGCRTFHIINRLSFSTLIQLFQRLAIKSINMFGDYSFIFFCWFFTAFLVLLLLLLKWTCAQTSERERSHRIYHTHKSMRTLCLFIYFLYSIFPP